MNSARAASLKTCLLLAAIGVPLAPTALYGQADTVTVIAGEHYAAGDFERRIVGSEYRDEWTTPIRVPVLRPDTFAGGLVVTQRGGGMQTASVRMMSADQTEYVFRSVDKDQGGGFPEDLRNTLVDDIAQDQISSKHPAAAIMVAPLLEAAGVLHVKPRLMIMPDHPFLGEHREEFAGMLGLIEERPNETDEGEPRFAGATRVIGTERLLERLEESSEDRIDAPAYLAARLMDLLVGDWDRHPDQWRWAQDDRGELRYWQAIPRDRDNAFSHYDGLIGVIGGFVRPFVVTFEEEYDDLEGMTYNARPLDRELLSGLPREVWDSVATTLQQRLTDEVIEDAVRQMPPEYWAVRGADLTRKLKVRRDGLTHVAAEFYERLATEVDIQATDEPDLAVAQRRSGGALAVRLHAGEETTEPYFERVFHPSETREVRVYLRGDGDRAVVRGSSANGVRIRFIGGGGDDVLVDSSSVRSGWSAAFYDDRGENRFITAENTIVDTRGYEIEAEVEGIAVNNPPPPRDWGASHSWFTPTADWRSDIKLVVGAGPSWTRYGFRRVPYARRISVIGELAPLHPRVGAEATMHTVATGGNSETLLAARATQLSVTRFHGFGNETSSEGSSSRFRVWSTEFGLEAGYIREPIENLRVLAGPVIRYFSPDPRADSPASELSAPGSSAFGVLGMQALAELDRRDSEGFPRGGVHLVLESELVPVAWGDADDAFARVELTGATYMPVPLPLESTLALRAGGAGVLGDAPLQYAAFLGGGNSLRGYNTGRFAGDASLFGNAELRTRLSRAHLWVARGDLGALALADVGRVLVHGEDSDRWHTGVGGGLWFRTLERPISFHLLYAYGEKHRLSAGLDMPF